MTREDLNTAILKRIDDLTEENLQSIGMAWSKSERKLARERAMIFILRDEIRACSAFEELRDLLAEIAGGAFQGKS